MQKKRIELLYFTLYILQLTRQEISTHSSFKNNYHLNFEIFSYLARIKYILLIE